jgi:hypothetical protein
VGSALRSIHAAAKDAVQDTTDALPTPPVTPLPATSAPPPRSAPAKSPNRAPDTSPRADARPTSPAVEGIGDAAADAVGVVTGAGSAGLPEPSAAGGDAAGRTLDADEPERSARGAVAVDRGDRSGAPISVRVAEVVGAQRWLARIWPAIALGGDGQSGGRAIGTVADDLLRPVLAVAAGLLSAPAAALEIGDAPLAGRSAPETAPRPDAPPSPVSPDGGRILYLFALAVLLALMGFTVWREFHVALRPWQHRH